MTRTDDGRGGGTELCDTRGTSKRAHDPRAPGRARDTPCPHLCARHPDSAQICTYQYHCPSGSGHFEFGQFDEKKNPRACDTYGNHRDLQAAPNTTEGEAHSASPVLALMKCAGHLPLVGPWG